MLFQTSTGFDRVSVDFGGFAAGEQPDPADSGGFRRIPVNSGGFQGDFLETFNWIPEDGMGSGGSLWIPVDSGEFR